MTENRTGGKEQGDARGSGRWNDVRVDTSDRRPLTYDR